MERTTPTAHEGLQAQRGLDLKWFLHVLASPDRQWQGRIVPVGDRGIVLGRATEMVDAHDVADPLLSRRHVEVRPGPRPEVLDVRDLGSKNGTWRGTQRISNAILSHDAVLRFGSTVAIVEGDLGGALDYAHPTPCIPGRSSKARRLRMDVDAAAMGDAPVLMQGPTGAGKEYVARELHARSGRTGPLVVVGAPTLSESAFEAEMFGIAPGASAHEFAREGLVSSAAGGTLVLDEIAEMPLALQSKLLRLLESGRYRPVGTAEERTSTTRILATTNADLDTCALQGRFRRDLLARLRTHVVTVPALAHRRCDLLEYADVLAPLSRAWAQALTPEALEALLQHGWPENLRELASLLQTLAPVAATRRIERENLPEWLGQTQVPAGRPRHAAGPLSLAPEPEALLKVLRRYYGNIAKVAAHYSRDRRQIYRWLKQSGISETDVADCRRGP